MSLSVLIFLLFWYIIFYNEIVAESSADYSFNFKWTIHNNKFVEMLNAKNGDKFESDSFSIQDSMWSINLYPNGWNEESKQWFGIMVYMLSKPPEWTKIIYLVTTDCPQINVTKTAIRTVYEAGDYGWSEKTLLNKIKKLDLSYFELITQIKILKIIFNDHDKILYQVPFILNNEYHFQWKVDSEILTEMKNGYHGQKFYSKVFNDTWTILIYPNGNSHTGEGWIQIHLNMCALPPNVWKIIIDYNISCIQTNTTSISSAHFDYKSYGWSWNKQILRLEEFKVHQEITFVVDIHILDVFYKIGDDLREIDMINNQILDLSTNQQDLYEINKKYENRLSMIDEQVLALNEQNDSRTIFEYHQLKSYISGIVIAMIAIWIGRKYIINSNYADNDDDDDNNISHKYKEYGLSLKDIRSKYDKLQHGLEQINKKLEVENTLNNGIDINIYSLSNEDHQNEEDTKNDDVKSIKHELYDLIEWKRTKSEEDNNSKCVICMINIRNYACIPCGHLCLCKSCQIVMQQKCPICRAKSKMIQIFK